MDQSLCNIRINEQLMHNMGHSPRQPLGGTDTGGKIWS